MPQVNLTMLLSCATTQMLTKKMHSHLKIIALLSWLISEFVDFTTELSYASLQISAGHRSFFWQIWGFDWRMLSLTRPVDWALPL